jgi:hypothetical protein
MTGTGTIAGGQTPSKIKIEEETPITGTLPTTTDRTTTAAAEKTTDTVLEGSTRDHQRGMMRSGKRKKETKK